MHVGGVTCDSAKAFHCINNEWLLPKLSFYGIKNIAGQWFKSHLHNRKQEVEIKSLDSNNSTLSNWSIIKHGVLQGTIPHPLLFLIYINVLPPTINSHSKPILFADDTNIIISYPETDSFQNGMKVVTSLNKWIKANKLIQNKFHDILY